MVAAVDELHGEVGELRDHVSQIARDYALATKPTVLPPLLPTRKHKVPIDPKEEDGDFGHGPDAHRAATQNRGKDTKDFTLEPPSGNSM